ncbi:hypothetical protein N431DRAFT_143119 [Stipitochalara longipes BDJ]|nr:hypothetical protein N431DRAFT_143119 [Stipitochalara longipes BDJ]
MRSFELTLSLSVVCSTCKPAARKLSRDKPRNSAKILITTMRPIVCHKYLSAGGNECLGLGFRKSSIPAYLQVTFLTNEEGNRQ